MLRPQRRWPGLPPRCPLLLPTLWFLAFEEGRKPGDLHSSVSVPRHAAQLRPGEKHLFSERKSCRETLAQWKLLSASKRLVRALGKAGHRSSRAGQGPDNHVGPSADSQNCPTWTGHLEVLGAALGAGGLSCRGRGLASDTCHLSWTWWMGTPTLLLPGGPAAPTWTVPRRPSHSQPPAPSWLGWGSVGECLPRLWQALGSLPGMGAGGEWAERLNCA